MSFPDTVIQAGVLSSCPFFHTFLSARVSYMRGWSRCHFIDFESLCSLLKIHGLSSWTALVVSPCEPRALTLTVLVTTETRGSILYWDSQQCPINHVLLWLDLYADCLCTAWLNKRWPWWYYFIIITMT